MPIEREPVFSQLDRLIGRDDPGAFTRPPPKLSFRPKRRLWRHGVAELDFGDDNLADYD